MNDWGYVIVGWLVTTMVIASYWGWLVVRSRRAAGEVIRLEDNG